MRSLPRLTKAMVDRAERGNMIRGWHALCLKGYMPEELYVHSHSAWPYSEVRFKVREYAKFHGLPIPANCATKIDRVRKVPVIEDPAAAFRATVMRTGLALVLTQPMLEELCALASGCQSDRALYFREMGNAAPHNFIASIAALCKRGLVTNDRKLTPIGEKLVEILKTAGVFKMPDAALLRQEKRA